jgi:trans-aconitate 2-methyltransferase
MKNVFEFDGNKYKKASAHQKEWGNKIISEFKFKGNEKILDLGCGDGVLTKQLSDLVPDGYVLGIDSSQGMINTAREIESFNMSFQLLNINDIDFKDEFDIVFSNAALHWIINHKKLLTNTCKALKKNGIVRFNFAGDGNCSTFFTVIKKVMGLNEFKDNFKDFQWPWYMPAINEYKVLVDTCDFNDIRIWEENADRFFPTKDDMIKWIDQPSIVPFLKLVNKKKKEKFRNIVVDEMVKRTEQSDGRCFETFRRINVYTKKL